MIEWLPRSAFRAEFESEYRPLGRYISEESHLDVSLAELQVRIPVASVHTPVDDEDFPGPVERWYGRVAGHLFLLTYYHHPSDRVAILALEPRFEAREAVRTAVQELLAPRSA